MSTADGGPARGPREIAGYQIEAEIGRGGMGVVFRAFDPRLGRTVAIKTIAHAGGPQSEAALRFLREARGLGRIGKHPHIVQIHEVGEVAERHFFVMDLVEGPTLADLVRNGPMPVARSVEIAEKIARALEHAHGHGLVHRDVKPSNVLLGRDGEPQLTDFGLAKDVRSDDGLSRTGDILGTPSYMAPEQAEAEGAVDARADVYGVGALLYHLVTGKPAFAGSTFIGTVALVLAAQLTPPRALRPELTRDLEAVIEKALERDPARRYASAGALADDLARVQRGEPVLARRRSPARRLVAAARRRPGMAAVLLLAAVAGIVAMVAGPRIAADRRRARADDLRAAAERAPTLAEQIALFDQAIALEPRSFEAIWGRARARIAEIGEITRTNERFNARYDVTALARLALADLDRALEVVPDAARPLLDRAEVRELLGDLEGAEQDHRRFAQSGEDAAAAYAARARQRAQVGDNRGAVALLERAIALAPERAALYRMRGGLRARFGEVDQGIADLDRAIALAPDDAESHYGRAHLVQAYRRDMVAAHAGFARTIELRPHDGNAWFARGNIKRLLNPPDLEGAETDYQRAMELAPTLVGPAVNLGVLRFGRGAHVEAREAFDRALEIDPTFAMAYYMRALTWLTEEPPEKARALADLDRACARGGPEPHPFEERGRLRLATGDAEGAIADLEAAAARFPAESAQRATLEREARALREARATPPTEPPALSPAPPVD